MRVLLKLVLDCDADAAWRALRSPAVFRRVSAPLMAFDSLDASGFTEQWSDGEHRVAARAFGLVPAGEQLIDIHTEERLDRGHGKHSVPVPVRIVHDTGRGLTWPLTLTTSWHHRMAVSALPDGRTLYRDELAFSAGPMTPLVWLAYWAFWQWRGVAIRRLAASW
ncbi:MAG: hypothetical protein JWM50_1347 [Microbacteriaceae bacterium]|jgi:hypothetical protein|nr:hypothetical protein [Microbacteriaceae bacterium]